MSVSGIPPKKHSPIPYQDSKKENSLVNPPRITSISKSILEEQVKISQQPLSDIKSHKWSIAKVVDAFLAIIKNITQFFKQIFTSSTTQSSAPTASKTEEGKIQVFISQLGRLTKAIKKPLGDSLSEIRQFLVDIAELKENGQILTQKILAPNTVENIALLKNILKAQKLLWEYVEGKIIGNQDKLIAFFNQAHEDSARWSEYEAKTYFNWLDIVQQYGIFKPHSSALALPEKPVTVPSARVGNAAPVRNPPPVGNAVPVGNAAQGKAAPVSVPFNPPRPSLQQNAPVGLPNPGINACYRNSSNQALRALGEPYFQKLRNPFETDELFNAREAALKKGTLYGIDQEEHFREKVRRALVILNEALDGKDEQMIAIANLELRNVLFDSKLNIDLQGIENLNEQQDAAAYVGTIFEAIIRLNIPTQKRLSATEPSGNVVTSVKKGEPQSLLQVSLDPALGDFQQMLEKDFGVEHVNDPNNAWKPGTKVFKEYDQEITLQGTPPEILAVQLKRVKLGGTGPVLDKQAVRIPADNIIDFSKAYNLPRGDARYKLTSFVVHHGISPLGGHYTSCVEKEGRWYHCDDIDVTPLTAAELEGYKQKAYLTFFKKL